jgi:uncharacterized integral membrane protein (TIGR00698 family)
MYISPGRRTKALEEARGSRPSLALRVRGWNGYFFEYVPGLSLLVSLAFLARFLGGDDNDSYRMICAILGGLLVRNLFGLPRFFEPGTRTYEVFWKGGIVLLGSQMGLQSFREVGLKGLGLAGFEILLVITGTLALARAIGIPAPLRYLLAIGMGICGVSAVIALAATLRTNEEDTGYAVSTILLFGLATLSLLPVCGRLFHLSDLHFGLWAGFSVNNTAEAVATGFVYSEAAGHFSILAKLSRNLFLGVALFYFVQRMVGKKVLLAGGSKFKAAWRYFPRFAIGLLLFSGLATVHFWSPTAVLELSYLYRWAFLFGFAGVGLRTDLSRLRRRGLKPLVFGLSIQIVMAAAMLVCVLLAF